MAKAIKPATSHKSHIPEGVTLGTLVVMPWRGELPELALPTAAAPSPSLRALCQGLCHGAATASNLRAPSTGTGTAREMLPCLVRACYCHCAGGLVLMAFSPYLLGLVTFPFTFTPLLWPDAKLVCWDRSRQRGCSPFVGLTHGVCSSYRPLQVYWEWDAQKIPNSSLA